MIVQDWTGSPDGGFHVVQIPANPITSSFAGLIATGILPDGVRFHSKNPSASTTQRVAFKGRAKDGLDAIVSIRALIILLPIAASFAQCGMRPHVRGSMTGPDSPPTTARTSCVGAML